MNTRNNPKNKQEIPEISSLRRKCDFKKADIKLSHKCFPEKCFDIVTTTFFKTSAEKSPWTKTY